MDINDYFFAWKPALFRMKTRGMTTFQKGIYRELIDEYMLTREPLPANDLALADISRVSIDIWNENKALILEKFEEHDGFLYHEHCNEELEFQERNSKKKSKHAKKAAVKRWEYKKKSIMPKSCSSDAQAMPDDATGQDNTGQDRTKEERLSSVSNPEAQMAFSLWNELAKELGLPLAQAFTDARRSRIKARLTTCGGLDGWKFALDKIRASAFLRGESERGWKAHLDFMLQESSFVKLMEGAYDHKPGRGPKGSGNNYYDTMRQATVDAAHDFQKEREQA